MPPEPASLRAFIALALPEALRRQVADFQRAWQRAVRSDCIRWTSAEQLHLTLRFLGDVPVAAVPDLEAALHRACAGVAGFELTVGGSGCFPDAHKPRVLWVGVGGALEALRGLQTRVERETQAWGRLEEREFRAHLTIGRVKAVPPPVLAEIARRAQAVTCGELGRWRVGEVLLMRSELTPAGARHTQLAGIPLG